MNSSLNRAWRIDIEVSLPEEGFASPVYQLARVLAAEYQTEREELGMGIAIELDEANQYSRDIEIKIKEWLLNPDTAAAATLMHVKVSDY